MEAVTQPPKKTNRIGLELATYRGSKTTLCAGCGHNAISERIIDAFYELGTDPKRVIKLSGIGCSSKTPAYFLNYSHGFNALHGRMPSVATGALVANGRLLGLGISGDGDTANIGIGQFKHACRRNLPMLYIVEDNGCYGLTKGQFSATADLNARLHGQKGDPNPNPPFDLCLEAIAAGATFVARSFAGDRKQLLPLLKAGLRHRGSAVIDIISPCVTFNNHEDSTKSYPYGKANEDRLHDITFIPKYDEIKVDYEEGTTLTVELHEGPAIQLKKLDREYDPTNAVSAIKLLMEAQEKREFITGLVYIDTKKATLQDTLNLPEMPLAHFQEDRLRPPREALDKLMQEMM